MENLKSALLIFMSVILLVLVSCSKDIANSLWHNKDIIQETGSADLETPLRFYDAKSRLQYTVLNDNENLYLCIKAMEDQTQLKIMRAGLQIWIDTTGRGKKLINLSYPLPAEDINSGQRADMKKAGNKDKNIFHNQFLLAHPDMMLTGFKPAMNGLVPVENKFGIAAIIQWDSIGTLVYKVRIPFRTFYHESLSSRDLMKVFSISLIVPALARNMNGGNGAGRGNRTVGEGAGGGMRGGMGGGMRGGMGGGMRGGMGGRGGRSGGGYSSGEQNDLSAETNIKMNIRLALNSISSKNK